MLRRVGLISVLGLLGAPCALGALGAAGCSACSKSEVKATGGTRTAELAPPRPTFTVFALAEVRGQIGPCGCTSDPLGDISRTARLVEQARAAGPVLFVDAGSLLYSQAQIPPMLDTQEELKATLLADTYQKAMKVDALGLGPADMSRGVDHLRLPRLVSNAPGVPAADPKVLEVGGARAGVFGVVAQGAVHGLDLQDPVAAGKAAVAKLRGLGAQVVIGLVQADSRKEAVRLVRDIGGIDLAIAGLGLGAPEPNDADIEAQRAGDAWLIVPVNRGQVVARVGVTVREPGPLADAVGPGAASAKLLRLDKQIAALDRDLAAFARDDSADQAFVAAKQQERARLAADRDSLKAHPFLVPQHGSFFTLEQVRINKALACDTAVQGAVSQFFRASGEANMKAAAATAVTPPPRGTASYAGTDSCADCHAEAVELWNKTVHAGAWKTLEERGQQFDLDCIGCHVTGWGKPGGSNLGHNEKLRDIQCETCHGPSSIHVAKGGLEKPFAVWRSPPADLCVSQCHTREHSDTFQLEAYLRDVLGPGHGEERRKKLGDGPTGAQLRKAALDKAGRDLGAGCTR